MYRPAYLKLCCLGLVVLVTITYLHAQTPQQQIEPLKKCPVTTTTTDNVWDFENGLDGWTSPESAFDSQPVDGRYVRTNHFPKLVNLGGDYWRGLPYPLGQHGNCLIFTGDSQKGSLISPEFTLRAELPYLNLLIGGSEDLALERFELQILSSSEEERRQGKYVIAWEVTGHNGPDGLPVEILQPKTFAIPSDLFGRTARFRIIDASPSAHINVDFVRFTKTADSYHGEVWGYADYHTHPHSDRAFGGAQKPREIHTVWGRPGTAAAEYDKGKLVADDIPHCTIGHDGGRSAELFINEAEHRRHGRSGGPEFRDFPSFLSGAHQQMHITQIRRNYQGGLRLMVAIVTHNRAVEYLVSKLNSDGKINPPTTDREVLEAGLKAMDDIAELNKDWMEIARTPEEARRIIGENKLAVILGIEVDQLGQLNPEKPESAETEVEYLWTRGIRAVIPIHGPDNCLGGAAVFRDIYNSTNDFLHRGEYNLTVKELEIFPPRFFQVREGGCWGPLLEQRGECVLFRLKNRQQRLAIKRIPILRRPFPEEVPAPMYDNFAGHKNVHGLTAYGREYIAALMKRGMIIDTAHMSDASVGDTFDVIGAPVKQKHSKCSEFSFEADYSKIPGVCFDDAYPTVISHAHFRAQSFYEEPTLVGLARPSEYQISNRNVQMVQRIGGALGPFVTEKPLSLPPEQHDAPFKNDCAGSSKGFGFSFRYGLQTMKGRGVGMATDFTFIPGVSPRFGDDACWAFHLAGDEKQEQERKLNPHLYDRDAQKDGVVYTSEIAPKKKIVKYGRNEPLQPHKMDQRYFDFNVDGLAHFGLIPDMLQDLKNIGLPQDDFKVLFSSAESYLQAWEKSLRVARDLPARQ